MASGTGPLLCTEDLLQAFEEDLEAPDLLSWKQWQAWRAREGRRPAIRRGDTVTTSIQQEGVMYRDVMEAIHGLD